MAARLWLSMKNHKILDSVHQKFFDFDENFCASNGLLVLFHFFCGPAVDWFCTFLPENPSLWLVVFPSLSCDITLIVSLSALPGAVESFVGHIRTVKSLNLHPIAPLLSVSLISPHVSTCGCIQYLEQDIGRKCSAWIDFGLWIEISVPPSKRYRVKCDGG